MKPLFILLLSIVFFSPVLKSSDEPVVCLNSSEKELLELIRTYRKKNRLADIPVSASLTYVAQIHARDLQQNKPHLKPQCNMHSWSGKGNWSECCYTNDHKKAECMWDKPRELTSYQGDGYEISFGMIDGDSLAVISVTDALDSWRRSPAHNAVILNQGIWKQTIWNAIGVGVSEKYATVWFGKINDENDKPKVCE